MCVLLISWQGEMTSNSRSIARTTTQPWNKEGVQSGLNLNRDGYKYPRKINLTFQELEFTAPSPVRL